MAINRVIVSGNKQPTKCKGSVNPEIVKNIARCNFLIITVMYIKVYISGMEMSQKIRFWHQILPQKLIFWENGKKSLFW